MDEGSNKGTEEWLTSNPFNYVVHAVKETI